MAGAHFSWRIRCQRAGGDIVVPQHDHHYYNKSIVVIFMVITELWYPIAK